MSAYPNRRFMFHTINIHTHDSVSLVKSGRDALGPRSYSKRVHMAEKV